MFGFNPGKKRARGSGSDPNECESPKEVPKAFVYDYLELRRDDIALVGHKNAVLAEVQASLSQLGLKIPEGFVLSVPAFHDFLDQRQLRQLISQELAQLEQASLRDLGRSAKKIAGWILKSPLPDATRDELTAAFLRLQQTHGSQLQMVVRSSPIEKDLPTASCVGRQYSFMNVRGAADLHRACLEIYASLFSIRSLQYCQEQGISLLDGGVSVGVQKMVRADLGVAGMMSTLDVQTGFTDVVSISASYGLGDLLAEGGVNPDEFLVFKPTLQQGFSAVLKRQRGSKLVKRVCGDGSFKSSTVDIATRLQDRMQFSLTREEVQLLARQAVAIEQFCAGNHRSDTPLQLEIEWAKDGFSGDFYILQVRDDTLHRAGDESTYMEYQLLESGWTLATGVGVGHSIVSGQALVANTLEQAEKLEPGQILVTQSTSPDWEDVLRRASAIVINNGGRYSHAGLIAQKYGIPAVVGCGTATDMIADGSEITVVCIERDSGYVYDGALAYRQAQRRVANLEPTDTRVSIAISNPERAFEYANLPVDGIGLAKMEYVVNQHIRVHPRALLEYEGQSPDVQFTIDDMVSGYRDRRSFYVSRLCEGIGMIAAAFYPKPVMLRTSDFRSNEYAALYAGEFFEDHEPNPEIGLRGAVRYFSPQFEECFALECEAIRNVREKMGLTNLHLVVPFVRTVDEGVRLLGLMERYGLKRGDNGLRINLMCETPANVLLAEEFLEHFDGFSIGTDDLMQLTLGIDRESRHFREIDERNKAVLKLVYLAIQACFRHGKHVNVCGHAVSHFPDFTSWLVNRGVQEITLDPEHYFQMRRVISEIESRHSTDDALTMPVSLKISA